MKLSSIVKYFFPRVINREGHGLFPAILVLLVLSSPPVLCQENAQRPSRNVAQDAWDRGNYETAYDQFNGLLLLYSRDPLYKYYTGACLVKLERDTPRAIELLGSAINSSVKVKSVPDDVWFWYGRALQMNGNFAQATEAFDKFTKAAGKRMAQEYKVTEYLDQCDSGVGAISMEHARISQLAEMSPAKREGTEQRGASGDRRAESPEQSAESIGQRTAIEDEKQAGRVNSSTDVPDDYETVLAEAVKIQHQADSLALIAEGARRDLEEAAPERAEEHQQITEEIEKRAADKQGEADDLFVRLEEQNEQPELIPEKKVQPQRPQILSRFEVKQTQAYTSNNPVPIDIDLPAGLVYTVQIAAFKNPPDPALFKGLFPVYGKLKQETGITFYYTGLFRRIEDARQALPSARGAGFPDAFIIALLDDTRVSMERAAILENEWGGQPLPGEPGDEDETATVESADAMMVGTLSFRAEVMRLDKPAKPELMEKLTLLAGTRGLDIIKNNNDETVLLIGNFITFDSAEDYVSLLIRNGYSSARVAAYVGKYEIPVEAARELIKKLPDD
jgi:tetratricopeptide (TPR) repeat protein